MSGKAVRWPHAANSSNNAFASFRSRVSKPSANQPYTGANSSRACCPLPWSRQKRARPDQARLEANSVAAMVAHSVARSPVAGGRRACRYQ